MKQRKKAEPGFQVFLIISLVMHLIGAGVAFASGRKTRTSILKLSSVNVKNHCQIRLWLKICRQIKIRF